MQSGLTTYGPTFVIPPGLYIGGRNGSGLVNYAIGVVGGGFWDSGRTLRRVWRRMLFKSGLFYYTESGKLESYMKHPSFVPLGLLPGEWFFLSAHMTRTGSLSSSYLVHTLCHTGSQLWEAEFEILEIIRWFWLRHWRVLLRLQLSDVIGWCVCFPSAPSLFFFPQLLIEWFECDGVVWVDIGWCFCSPFLLLSHLGFFFLGFFSVFAVLFTVYCGKEVWGLWLELRCVDEVRMASHFFSLLVLFDINSSNCLFRLYCIANNAPWCGLSLSSPQSTASLPTSPPHSTRHLWHPSRSPAGFLDVESETWELVPQGQPGGIWSWGRRHWIQPKEQCP